MLLKVFRLNKEPPAGGRGNAPLELDSWPVCGNCPAPVPPGQKHLSYCQPTKGGGVKVSGVTFSPESNKEVA